MAVETPTDNYGIKLAATQAEQARFRPKLAEALRFYKRGLYSPAEFLKSLTANQRPVEIGVSVDSSWVSSQGLESFKVLTVGVVGNEVKVTHYKGTYVGVDEESVVLGVTGDTGELTQDRVTRIGLDDEGLFEETRSPIDPNTNKLGITLTNAFLNLDI